MVDDPDDLPLDGGADDAAKAEQEAYEGLIGLSVQDILKEGQKELFARLVGAVRAGTATHQQQAILRNVLKDNGLIFLGLDPKGEGGQQSQVEQHPLPEFDVPDYDK